LELIPTWNDVSGWAAAALTLLAFSCNNIVRLRYVALSANVAFIAYGFTAQLWPVLALHAVLVPINLWRLWQAMQSAEFGGEATPVVRTMTVMVEPDRHA
jgi:hypothetical protein